MHRRHFLSFPILAWAAGSSVAGAEITPSFDAAVDAVAPEVPRRASVILVDGKKDAAPVFREYHYRGEPDATDFWPASTIKIHAVLAALELVHEQGFPLDVTVSFEHRSDAGKWVLDCARTLREMIHEVFIRSSNEDYTLLLRMSGLDLLNGSFLTPERGFKKSALMRGYVSSRPHVYRKQEAQRITLRSGDTVKSLEHQWTGRSYSAERGATVIDTETGNISSTADMARAVQRVLFSEYLPEAERWRISPEMLEFLRHGDGSLTGFETRNKDSGPYAWEQSGELVYPQAKFYHKCGLISNYVLDLACVDDRALSGRAVIIAACAMTGKEETMRQLCHSLLTWARAQPV